MPPPPTQTPREEEEEEEEEVEEEEEINPPDREATAGSTTMSEEEKRRGDAQARGAGKNESDMTAPKRARSDEAVDVESTTAQAAGEVEQAGDATSQVFIATQQENLKDEDEPEIGPGSGSKRPRLD